MFLLTLALNTWLFMVRRSSMGGAVVNGVASVLFRKPTFTTKAVDFFMLRHHGYTWLKIQIGMHQVGEICKKRKQSSLLANF